MQIIIHVDLNHEEEKKKQEQADFLVLAQKLKALGYNMNWSLQAVERGSAMSLTINTKNQQPTESALKMWSGDTIFALYCMIGGSSDRSPLSIRMVLDHFEALIIEENQELLKRLYREKAEQPHQERQTKS